MINYSVEPLINDLPLKLNEQISSISSFERNVYIGTSIGNLFHYHLFDDATSYFLITHLPIGSEGVKDISCLENIQKLVLVIDDHIETFSLPELSPFATNKLDNVKSISPYKDGNSIIAIESNKVSFLHLENNQWIVVKNIDYTDAVKVTPPLKDLMLLANKTNYSALDLTTNSITTLFEYQSDLKISPYLVPFQSSDDLRGKECLLTISSDENTSIAMFINSNGEATRGTLSWINQGYPKGGVVINWPYVFAVFDNSLIVSSLETLEKTLKIELTELEKKLENNDLSSTICDFNISRVNILYEDKHLQELIGNFKTLTSNIVLFNKDKVFLLNEENSIISANNFFHESLESNEFDNILNLHDDSDYVHLLKTLVAFLKEMDPVDFLLAKNEDGSLKINPNLSLRLLGEDVIYEVFPGLQETLEQWDYKDEEMVKKYLQSLEPSEMTPEARKLYYKLSSPSHIKNFIDRDIWSDSKIDHSIINILLEDTNKQYLVSNIYKLLPDRNSPDYRKYLLKYMNHELIDDALEFLRHASLEEIEYSKLLLSIIKLDKSKGYEYMRQSKQYHEVNRRILNSLSDVSKDEDFALLQIELLETSFLEDVSLKDELLDLIMSTLKSMYDESVRAQINNTHTQYQTLNSLQHEEWPKRNWISFLRLLKNSGEFIENKNFESFINLYLKSFELAICSETKIDLFEYHHIYRNQNISKLLEFGDFSTAENLALGKHLELKIYKQLDPKPIEFDKDKLEIIFQYYLKKFEQDERVEFAIQHFIDSYGKHFSTSEILNSLPDKLPFSTY
ncbi:uncharacterized protein KGF55_003796 [Candida pseudojiufengensis]|uniref:uncharacterized protein n=1 Tax=Candida pseudojiufengensis TaxID=497109 RepID=UPI002224CCF2|nr:uncharacterized protein KGF55_003796 [Candida pseudojiufengensis]KAI5961825.1 hypothetical protein KGF55_003796 [Candida pseudojiufengensis]